MEATIRYSHDKGEQIAVKMMYVDCGIATRPKTRALLEAQAIRNLKANKGNPLRGYRIDHVVEEGPWLWVYGTKEETDG